MLWRNQITKVTVITEMQVYAYYRCLLASMT